MNIPLWSATPFVLMLLAIALFPIFAERFWHSDRNKGVIVAALALPVALWLLLQGPPASDALLHELQQYGSFMAMLFALYVVAGGIVLFGDLRGTPSVNVSFLALGAILANVIGTTGASMVLIRPVLRINHDRTKIAHLPIFFTFLVGNLGGLLTPLGDPPLFLGYLHGVDFLWTLRLWPQWLLVNGLTLGVFFVWDTLAWRHESAISLRLEGEHIKPLRLAGRFNIVLIVAVVICVLFRSPAFGAKLGLTLLWPWNDLALFALASLSLLTTRRGLRRENRFTWGPIREVAIIFAGIFVTMVPALHLLQQHGKALGVTEPWQFFWLTGLLSSFLDNAPTYLVFATMAGGSDVLTPLALNQPRILEAISCGAVFLGAMTYVGNGPNFMIKAIAEHSKYPTPSFFGYMAYSYAVLLPIFALVTLVFFRPF